MADERDHPYEYRPDDDDETSSPDSGSREGFEGGFEIEFEDGATGEISFQFSFEASDEDEDELEGLEADSGLEDFELSFGDADLDESGLVDSGLEAALGDLPETEEESNAEESGPGIDPNNLMMIVVGAHLRAEVADRPLAYRLHAAVNEWLEKHQDAITEPFVPVVCSDVWYVNHRSLQRRPTISIGGPGVNALSAYYADKLDPSLVEENHFIIQLDPEFVDLRACVWGMNHDLTVKGLDVFIDRYLDGFLRAVVSQVEPHVD